MIAEILAGLIVDAENNLCEAYPYTTNEFRINATAEHLALNGVVVQQWFSVIDNPPVIGINVLFCGPKDGRFIASAESGPQEDGTIWCRTNNGLRKGVRWMPLP